MELKNYSITQEQDYNTIAAQFDVLAEALLNEQQGNKILDKEEQNEITQSVLTFLKGLL